MYSVIEDLRNIHFYLKVKIFKFFEKNGNGKEKAGLHVFKQKEFDKKLVQSLSKSRIPSLRQIKYASKILSNKELRDMTRERFNGEYAVRICRNCHRYWTNPEGNVNTAKIIKKCKNCSDS